ncbi:hypothetical protein IEQ34_010637 [Dendrobium chrysotoxum]|uniref:Uncharacterized protein n=1 Tax=Dendrobium chrysotoxum TaxID=161865 RepID=A0AAV7GDW5_DENCH|nr:hypothetical protein IEQ34_010637 [Dendrobium chrysotoxum]
MKSFKMSIIPQSTDIYLSSGRPRRVRLTPRSPLFLPLEPSAPLRFPWPASCSSPIPWITVLMCPRITGCRCRRSGIGRSCKVCLIIPWISLRLERVASRASPTTPESPRATKPTYFLKASPPPPPPPLPPLLQLFPKNRLGWGGRRL